jgi:hypothetical protein
MQRMLYPKENRGPDDDPKLQLKEVLFCAVDNKSRTGGLSYVTSRSGRLCRWVLGLVGVTE